MRRGGEGRRGGGERGREGEKGRGGGEGEERDKGREGEKGRGGRGRTCIFGFKKSFTTTIWLTCANNIEADSTDNSPTHGPVPHVPGDPALQPLHQVVLLQLTLSLLQGHLVVKATAHLSCHLKLSLAVLLLQLQSAVLLQWACPRSWRHLTLVHQYHWSSRK